jgi:hypothetical protein
MPVSEYVAVGAPIFGVSLVMFSTLWCHMRARLRRIDERLAQMERTVLPVRYAIPSAPPAPSIMPAIPSFFV